MSDFERLNVSSLSFWFEPDPLLELNLTSGSDIWGSKGLSIDLKLIILYGEIPGVSVSTQGECDPISSILVIIGPDKSV